MSFTEKEPTREKIVAETTLQVEQLRTFESLTATIKFTRSEARMLSFLKRRWLNSDPEPLLTVDEQDVVLENPRAFISRALQQETKQHSGHTSELQRRHEEVRQEIGASHAAMYLLELRESMVTADSCRAWSIYVKDLEFQPVLGQDLSPEVLGLRVAGYLQSFLAAARQARRLNRAGDGLCCQRVVEKFQASPLSPNSCQLVRMTETNSRLKAAFWRDNLEEVTSHYRYMPDDLATALKRYDNSRPGLCRRAFDLLADCPEIR